MSFVGWIRVGSFSDNAADLYALDPSIESQVGYPDLSFSKISLVSLKTFSTASYQFTIHNYPKVKIMSETHTVLLTLSIILAPMMSHAATILLLVSYNVWKIDVTVVKSLKNQCVIYIETINVFCHRRWPCLILQL